MDGTGCVSPGNEIVLGNLQKRSQYLQESHLEDAARIFIVVHGGSMRDNGH